MRCVVSLRTDIKQYLFWSLQGELRDKGPGQQPRHQTHRCGYLTMGFAPAPYEWEGVLPLYLLVPELCIYGPLRFILNIKKREVQNKWFIIFFHSVTQRNFDNDI